MIAGLRFDEMQMMPPGLILDMFIYRRDYDDMENGIKREIQQIYD